MRRLRISLISLLLILSSCSPHAESNKVDITEKQDPPVSAEAQVDNLLSLEESEMKETIESYVKGADEQLVELVDKAFHENFQVVAHSEGAIRVVDKPTYLELLNTGKIGGVNRQIEYIDMQEEALVGTARVNLVGEKVTFHDHLSLVKEEGRWKIVANVTYVSPNS